jgi:hypothetical protein
MTSVTRIRSKGTPGSRFEPAAMGRPRGFFIAVLPLILAMGLVWWPFGGGHKVEMTAASSVPSAHGTVKIGHDRNKNTTVDLEVKHLAHPSALTPSAIVYVVWIQADGHPAENQGELTVDDNLNGRFKGSTPYKQFSIFVTAEQTPQVRRPTGEQLLTAAVTR